MGLTFCSPSSEEGSFYDDSGKLISKGPWSEELKLFLKARSPKDFLSLTKAKKIILTQEQQAAISNKAEKTESLPFDITPAEFFISFEAYLKKEQFIDQIQSTAEICRSALTIQNGNIYEITKFVCTVTGQILGKIIFNRFKIPQIIKFFENL